VIKLSIQQLNIIWTYKKINTFTCLKFKPYIGNIPDYYDYCVPFSKTFPGFSWTKASSEMKILSFRFNDSSVVCKKPDKTHL